MTRNIVLATASALLASLLFLNACKKEGMPPSPTSLEIWENARIIDTTVLHLVLDTARLANGEYAYQFSGAAPAYQVGDVIAGHEGGGYLRRITGIQKGANEVVFQTEQAALDDVFKRGKLGFDLDLSDLKPRGDGLEFSFQNVSFQDGPLSVTLNEGAFNLSADWVFDFQFDSTGVQYAEISAQHVALTGNCTATFAASQAATLYDQTETIASFSKSTWVTMPGVPFPLYAVLDVALVLQYSASVSANTSLQAKYATKNTLKAGIWYDGNQWNNSYQFTPVHNLDVAAPTGSANAVARFSIGPQVSVKLYGVAGPYLRLTLEEELKGNVAAPQLDWDFSADAWVKTVLGVEAEILDNQLADYSKDWATSKLNRTMPYRLQRISGDNQTGPTGQTLPHPIRVRVLDSDGRPQSNVPVYFAVQSGGGAVVPGSILSDANGYAEAQWTLGANPGVLQYLQVSARKANGQNIQDSPLDFAASGTSNGCNCNPNSSLCLLPPTENAVRQGLAGFAFGPGPGNMTEAKSILQFLCAEVQHEYVYPDGTARVCGVFPTGYEVTLWTPTYGSSDRYGVRYGLLSANHSYFGSNATYFELVK